MEKVYIFGHKNPDTDSVAGAIALTYLKRNLGIDAEARVIGNINDETKYVLDYLKMEYPKYLNDVRLQIKDVSYHKDLYITETVSIDDTYALMNKKNITGVPVVDSNKRFKGILTAKILLKKFFDVDNNTLYTSYDNILKSLSGTEILKFEDEIVGNVKAVSFRSTTFIENIKLTDNDILIVGDRHSIIESAVNNGVKLLVITGNNEIKEEHINIARQNKVNIIKTPFETFKTVKKIVLSNYIKTLLEDTRAYTIQENEYYEDFIEESKSLGFNNYPVVDKNNVCKGLLRITQINKKNKKKVILVDHNESEQSAIGLNESEILEIIDHHKIGNISTKNPINFRNMAVGSTNTIIYYLYQENRIEIPKNIALLMLSGIISDTLNLTSPTTTQIDILVANKLESICGVNKNELAKNMFEASSNFDNKTEEELINTDIKEFEVNGSTFQIGQITAMYTNTLLQRKDKLIEKLEELKCDFALLMITDISKNGAYVLYTKSAEKVLEKAFGIEFYQGIFMGGVVSRKKQIVPRIMESE